MGSENYRDYSDGKNPHAMKYLEETTLPYDTMSSSTLRPAETRALEPIAPYFLGCDFWGAFSNQ